MIEWTESTKVIDYLNQVRQRTIVELKKAQEDSLEQIMRVESRKRIKGYRRDEKSIVC